MVKTLENLVKSKSFTVSKTDLRLYSFKPAISAEQSNRIFSRKDAIVFPEISKLLLGARLLASTSFPSTADSRDILSKGPLISTKHFKLEQTIWSLPFCSMRTVSQPEVLQKLSSTARIKAFFTIVITHHTLSGETCASFYIIQSSPSLRVFQNQLKALLRFSHLVAETEVTLSSYLPSEESDVVNTK